MSDLPPRKKKRTVESPNDDDEQKESQIFDLDPAGLSADVERLLKFSTFEPEHRYWLDTGDRDLNRALGSWKLGIPYGKQIELAGLEHAGKTVLATILAGMAQRDGAAIGYVDLEDSRDPKWAKKLGLDWSKVFATYPKLVQPKAKKSDSVPSPSKKKVKVTRGGNLPRLQSSEEIFEEAEMGMALLAQRGAKKQFWVVDSIANIQPLKVIEAGVANQTMNTRMERSVFLSTLLPRWAGLSANYNATICFLNHLRQKQGIVFGDPFDTPGGRSLKHNLAVRARVARVKNGLLRDRGKVAGIIFKVSNKKNKAGHGSVQDAACGARVVWKDFPAVVEFMSVAEAEGFF